MPPRWVRRIRRATRRWIPALCIPLALPLAILALPFVMLWGAGVERRKLDAAYEFRCGNCRCELGEAAVRAADAEWRLIIESLIQQHGRVRLDRWFHAICRNCGRYYEYDDRSGSFMPVESSAKLRAYLARPLWGPWPE